MPSVWIQWRASGADPCAVRSEGFAGNPCRVDTSAKAVSAASRLRRATRRVCLAGWGGGRGWSSPIVLGQSPLTGPAPFLPVSPWNPRVLPQLGTPRWHFLAVVWVDIAQVVPLEVGMGSWERTRLQSHHLYCVSGLCSAALGPAGASAASVHFQNFLIFTV